VARWDPPPPGKDPYDDRILVQRAILSLQEAFNAAIEELEKLNDAELTEADGH